MSFVIELLKVIIFGIVEGITEWLPVSSTGHLILLDEILKLNVTPEFKEMFDVLIQLGAILAVIILFFPKICPFGKNKSKDETCSIIKLWLKILVASVPAGVLGILFDDFLDSKLHNAYVVSAMLILYGVFFVVLENYNLNKKFKINETEKIDYRTAFIIGMFQVLALIPGTSRSGATILGAMLIGVCRGAAAEFSFFMAIPAMLGGSMVKLLKFGFDFTVNEMIFLTVGMFVAFLISLISIKWLMGYVRKHSFKGFGIYRMVLGVIVIGYFVIF
jgi:undecaprenyl-diphosphatase UppP